jgi:uncharacterized protein
VGVSPRSERSRVRRAPGKARYDEGTVHEIIDAVACCHVGVTHVRTGDVVVLPFLHARVGTEVLLHGSRSNQLLASLLAADRVCATFTSYDGLRVARTGFQSSVIYRSVVAFGPVRLLEDDEERERALDAMVEAILPGRSLEIRRPNATELALTTVVSLSIEEASAKVSVGPTEDAPEDVASPVWAGDVPAALVYSTPVGAADGAMADGGVPIPPSIRALLER